MNIGECYRKHGENDFIYIYDIDKIQQLAYYKQAVYFWTPDGYRWRYDKGSEYYDYLQGVLLYIKYEKRLPGGLVKIMTPVEISRYRMLSGK